MSQTTCPIASKLTAARLRELANGTAAPVDGEVKELACRLLKLQGQFLEAKHSVIDIIF